MELHNQPNICPFCGEAAEKVPVNDDIRVKCRACGNYKITDDFSTYTGIEDHVIKRISGGDADTEDIEVPLHELQGIIYEKNLNRSEPHIGWSPNDRWQTLKQLVSTVNIPQTPLQKVDRLLENLAKESQNNFGSTLTLGDETHKKLAYAKNSREFNFHMNNALELGFLQEQGSLDQGYRVSISLKGWERIEALKGETLNSKQGFIAHWFGLDPRYLQAIKTGVDDAHFKPVSLAGANFPETILSKAFGEINRSRFVVVDLTGQRPSVLVEAGYALGKNIQTILVINREYWEELKKSPKEELEMNHKEGLEFYMTNYNIKKYSSPEELTEVVTRAIQERIL